jgi:hypothetical protein
MRLAQGHSSGIPVMPGLALKSASGTGVRSTSLAVHSHLVDHIADARQDGDLGVAGCIGEHHDIDSVARGLPGGIVGGAAATAKTTSRSTIALIGIRF